MITSDERKDILGLLSEAQISGARQAKACEIIGINAKTIQRGAMKITHMTSDWMRLTCRGISYQI